MWHHGAAISISTEKEVFLIQAECILTWYQTWIKHNDVFIFHSFFCNISGLATMSSYSPKLHLQTNIIQLSFFKTKFPIQQKLENNKKNNKTWLGIVFFMKWLRWLKELRVQFEFEWIVYRMLSRFTDFSPMHISRVSEQETVQFNQAREVHFHLNSNTKTLCATRSLSLPGLYRSKPWNECSDSWIQ